MEPGGSIAMFTKTLSWSIKFKDNDLC